MSAKLEGSFKSSPKPADMRVPTKAVSKEIANAVGAVSIINACKEGEVLSVANAKAIHSSAKNIDPKITGNLRMHFFSEKGSDGQRLRLCKNAKAVPISEAVSARLSLLVCVTGRIRDSVCEAT